DAQIAEMQETLEKLKQEHDSALSGIKTELETERQKTKDMGILKDQEDKMTRELEQVKVSLDSEREKVNQLQAKLKQLNDRSVSNASTLETDIQQLRAQLEEKEQVATNSKSAFENKISQLEETIKSQEEVQSKLSSLEKKSKEWQTNLNDEQARTKEITEALTKAEQANKELESKLEGILKELSTAQSKLSQNKDESEKGDQLKDGLSNQEIEALKTEIERLKSQVKEQPTEFADQEELESSKKEIKKLRGQLALAKGQSKKNDLTLENFKKRIHELEGDTEGKKMADIQQADIKRQLQKKDKKLEGLQQQVARLLEMEGEYKQIKIVLKEKEERLDALTKANDEALEEASDRALNPTEAEQKMKELREKVRELEERCKMTPEKEELEHKLQRQFEAFTTIRNELTAQRERQFDSETRLQKEKSQIDRERQELRVNVDRMKVEYEEQLEKMWDQHEAMRHRHESNLTFGRAALDSAQTKLMLNGHSPVSESGFDWASLFLRL
ncbi:hypothetical protein CU098_000245, partial [Rhizopus stolonifer]